MGKFFLIPPSSTNKKKALYYDFPKHEKSSVYVYTQRS